MTRGSRKSNSLSLPVDGWIVESQPGKTKDDWVMWGGNNKERQIFFVIINDTLERDCSMSYRSRRDRMPIDNFNRDGP